MKDPTEIEIMDCLKDLLEFLEENQFEYALSVTVMLGAIDMICKQLKLPPEVYDSILEKAKREYRKNELEFERKA